MSTIIFDSDNDDNDENDENDENDGNELKEEKKVDRKFKLKNIKTSELESQYLKSDLNRKFQNSLINSINSMTNKLDRLQLSEFESRPDEKLLINDLSKINLFHTKTNFIQGTLCFNCCEKIDIKYGFLSLPFKYYPSIIKIKSKIPDSDQYHILTQSLTRKEREEREKKEKKRDKEKKDDKENDMILEIREYYDCDGFFCHRVGCLLRYYYDNRHLSLYRNSLQLIRQMLKQISTTPLKSFKSFPNKRVLSKFGGFLSIDEYYRTTTDDVNIIFQDSHQFNKSKEGKSNRGDKGDKENAISIQPRIFEQIEMNKGKIFLDE